jgi:hypothetical protein
MPYGTWYKPGDWNVIDDLSGFRLKHSQSRKIPGGQTGGLVVDKKRWEPQQPQDFVRGIADDQSIPEPRPRQQNRFVITATYVTAFAPRTTPWVTVDSTEGFNLGDRLSVMLDNGDPYYPIIVALRSGQLRLTPGLPHSVGGPYADPIQNVIVNLGPSGQSFLSNDGGGTPIVDDYGDLFWVP